LIGPKRKEKREGFDKSILICEQEEGEKSRRHSVEYQKGGAVRDV